MPSNKHLTMSEIKIIKGKVEFLCVSIPADVTWYELIDNTFGSFISRTLELGGKFLQYGKDGATYFNPDTFYCVQNCKNPQIICKLSEITEEQASLLVDYWDLSDDYSPHTFKGAYPDYCGDMEYDILKTAKESLFSLLKANGCWIKDWCGLATSDTDEAFKWQQSPDDYLLIIKQ